MREIYACAPKSQRIRLNVHRVVFVHPVPPREYNTVRFVAKEHQQRLYKKESVNAVREENKTDYALFMTMIRKRRFV